MNAPHLISLARYTRFLIHSHSRRSHSSAFRLACAQIKRPAQEAQLAASEVGGRAKAVGATRHHKAPPPPPPPHTDLRTRIAPSPASACQQTATESQSQWQMQLANDSSSSSPTLQAH